MNCSNILITGGAGYIGSLAAKVLSKAGLNIIILDNLTTGHQQLAKYGELIVGDINNQQLVTATLTKYNIDTVLHFAASTIVPDSFLHPLEYYKNNTFGTLSLLNSLTPKVKNFILSSTAAVYSASNNNLISESCPALPLSPYGKSKLMAEQILQDFAKSCELNYAILRYFNVAGADIDLELGQINNSQHLIKSAILTNLGKQEFLPIYGNDYDTSDGTCIRDFIHVTDLANAHLKAIEFLNNSKQSILVNCGYSKGYSVNQVISTLEKLTSKTLPVKIQPKRLGDLPKVIADNSKIIKNFNWQPLYNNLDIIIESALEWEKRL